MNETTHSNHAGLTACAIALCLTSVGCSEDHALFVFHVRGGARTGAPTLFWEDACIEIIGSPEASVEDALTNGHGPWNTWESFEPPPLLDEPTELSDWDDAAVGAGPPSVFAGYSKDGYSSFEDCKRQPPDWTPTPEPFAGAGAFLDWQKVPEDAVVTKGMFTPPPTTGPGATDGDPSTCLQDSAYAPYDDPLIDTHCQTACAYRGNNESGRAAACETYEIMIRETIDGAGKPCPAC